MRMTKAQQTSRLGSDRSTDENDFRRTVGAVAARSAHLLGKASLFALGCSILAQPALAQAAAEPVSAQQGVEDDDAGGAQDGAEPSANSSSDAIITVTGTRIVNNTNSPTPITTAAVEEMAATTPSDIADGLNKLPQIIGGRAPRTPGHGRRQHSG